MSETYLRAFESATGMAAETLTLIVSASVIISFYVWAAWIVKGYWSLYSDSGSSQADLFASAGRAILLVLIVSFLLGKTQ